VKLSILLFALLLPLAEAQPPDAVNCAGADLSNVQSVVYVSPDGADSGTCGQNPASACKTIQRGINNCKGDNCGTLVRYGVYGPAASVQLVNGVSVYGSCVFDGSERKYRSTVLGRPAISANNISKTTILSGFVIMGTDAGAGQASVAMTVSNSTGLALNHNVLASGRGGNGNAGVYADGARGGDGNRANGNTGGAGGGACPANPPTGTAGLGGKGADFKSIRSSGCFALCNCENNNYPNSVGKNGESSGNVLGGGGGERGKDGCDCGYFVGDSGDGPRGGNGGAGNCGTAGGTPNNNNKGSFNGTTWIASSGNAGDAGQVGSGGGGGGSGGFGVNIDNSFRTTDYPGKAGGGGGGGGCGGPGGRGGQQGGASIPLVVFDSSVTGLAATNVLIPGPGGRGGDGAAGGKGGPGGNGVPGPIAVKHDVHSVGFCRGWVPGSGGEGGGGGQGGAGSGGAGGNGGPSFGIALVNSPALGGGIKIYAAQAGSGGKDGSAGQNAPPQCKGADGQKGGPGFSDNNNSIVSFTSTAQL
jgi:hypothetical protein